jgi:Clostridial hydrophobic W
MKSSVVPMETSGQAWTISTLDDIGLRHGTDKASSHHNCLEFYETFFAPLRHRELTLLEIGVYNGASLKTWEEYFPNTSVIGVDIVSASKRYELGRIKIELADQSNVEELTSVAIKHGPFDIIIEDGSHLWEHQITSLRTLFPFLKNGGLYIVEDLQTNYGSMQANYKGVAHSSCVEYLKAWLDLRVADNQIPIDNVEDAFLRTYGRSVQFMTFYRRACLIKKQLAPTARGASAGQPIIARHGNIDSVAVPILAHLGNIGDVEGPAGFINIGSDTAAFQGIAINSKDEALEYRVRFLDGSWSDWGRGGDFVGTRGQSRSLTGFTLRLSGNSEDRYNLCAFGLFAGSQDPIKVSDGQDCISSSGAELCGIQIELTKRAA